MLELPRYYEATAVTRGVATRLPPPGGSELPAWSALTALPAELGGKASCPTCRHPISGCTARRYGRAVKKVQLDLIDRKHMASVGLKLRAQVKRLERLERVDEGSGGKAREARVGDVKACIKELRNMMKTERWVGGKVLVLVIAKIRREYYFSQARSRTENFDFIPWPPVTLGWSGLRCYWDVRGDVGPWDA